MLKLGSNWATPGFESRTAREAMIQLLSPLTLQPPVWRGASLPSVATDSSDAVFIADRLDDWMLPESSRYGGLLSKRAFNGRWDAFQSSVDECALRFQAKAIRTSRGSPTLSLSLDKLLDAATELPAPLSSQIHEDACSLIRIWESLCPTAEEFEVKLEIFGERMCARWHQDHVVGRAIVSYTGDVGTEYTRPTNVNFRELNNGSDNHHIIRDLNGVESAAVGDLLLIKGTKFPQQATALVHKSPEKRWQIAPDDDGRNGRVLNRLVLKVDVFSAGPEQTCCDRPNCAAQAVRRALES